MKRFNDNIILEKTLGQGGMGTVYEAQLSGPGEFKKRVAVKVPSPDFTKDRDLNEAFLREARIMAKLSHPNIASVFQVGTHDSTPYMIIEFIEGFTLKQILEMSVTVDKPLRHSFVVYLISQIARAIEYAHAQGVIHRDLSPHNIMIDKYGTVKVLDFGISKILTEKNDDTTTRALKGKFAYLSPEVVSGKPATESSDIFALVSIFFELLYGLPAFKGASDLETINNVKGALTPDLPNSHIEIPRKIRAAIKSCLSRDPKRRLRTCTDVLLQLSTEGSDSPQQAVAYLTALKAEHDSSTKNSDVTVKDKPLFNRRQPYESRKKAISQFFYSSAGALTISLTVFLLWPQNGANIRTPQSTEATKPPAKIKDVKYNSVSGQICSRICHKGVACGDTCIPKGGNCQKSAGSACNEND